MLKALIRPSISSFACLAAKQVQNVKPINITRNFSQLSIQPAKPSNLISSSTTNIISNPGFLKLNISPSLTQARTVIKFTLKKGKRKSVHAALKRFKRLDWGIWIRTKTARHKRIWKKSGAQRRRAKQHVFCNATQSFLLDKMVTARWRKPKYYVDDPYRPYHERENYWATRKKPIEWDF